MGMSSKKLLLRVALLTAVAAVPVVAQPSTAGAQVLGGAHAPAKASTYPAPTPNPASVTAGASTTVSGVQCDPSFGPTNVFVSLVAASGNVLASTSQSPNPDGTWQATLTVPPDSAAGAYSIYSTCDMYYTEFYYPSVALTVAAASPSPWTVQGTVNQKGPTGTVTGISCPAASACTAVGTFVNVGGQTAPMIQRWNGTKWTGSALPTLAGEKAYGLNAVSCPSTTACTAVGNYVSASGRQLTFSEVWSGATWVIQKPVNPTGGSSDVLDSVSCTSSSVCTAVGSYNSYVNGQFQSMGLAEVWNGATWSVQSISAPAGHGAFGLTSVSCSAISSCIATGWYSATPYSYYGSVPLAMQWNGVGWTQLTLAVPVDASSFGESVASVSCSSATTCTAVGSYFSSANGPTPLVERWNGTAWAIQAAARPPSGYYPTMTSVSCSGTSTCESVGWYYSTSGEAALAEAWDGTAWTVQAVPSPANAAAVSLTAISCATAVACSATGGFAVSSANGSGPQQDWAANLATGVWVAKTIPALAGTGFDQLQSVSCSAISACTAVGSFENSKGQGVALAERWNGTGWTAQSLPLPVGATGSSLSGISCASATECIAVGFSRAANYVQSALIESWNGTSWSIVPTPVPTGTSNSSLDAVSCSAANACTAIGAFTSSISSQTAFLAERWNGSTWTASAVAVPTDYYFGQLSSVSCSGVSTCVAVGSYFSVSYTSQPLVEAWDGASWTVTVLSNAPEAGSALTSVSCATTTTCVAVGSDYGSNSGTSGPLVELWNGTTWSAQSAAGGGRGAVLSGISCTSATTCTATGFASVYGFPNQVPLAETWDGSTWIEQPMPKLPNAAAGSLLSVSCVTASACATVGTRNLGSYTTLAEGEGGA